MLAAYSSDERVDAATTVAWSSCQNRLNLFWKVLHLVVDANIIMRTSVVLLVKYCIFHDRDPEDICLEQYRTVYYYHDLHILFLCPIIETYHSVFICDYIYDVLGITECITRQQVSLYIDGGWEGFAWFRLANLM